MQFENLLIEKKGNLAVVIINQPKVLNALNRKTIQEITEAMTALGDDNGVRVVILTGAGEKSFVAGADISELAKLDPLSAQETARFGQRMTRVIESMGKPVIAAVNGFALGGGCELAMACTLRIASERAKFGQPEVKLGLIPGYGGTQRLARLVGCGRALEMILAGDPIPAAEAHRIGLVNRVVPPEALMEEAEKLAAAIASVGPVAVRLAMEAVYGGYGLTLGDGLEWEAGLFGLVLATEDAKEGLSAFLEKRPAEFKGS
ncbi:MAG: enoyl-CoA hydratase/isomerase family protein [Candidatus Eisenbacteria sp.]|nr:enoyl-CoA hydratase/isomerase family protein [Candidatus Eisenbacteria bacterium]